MFTGEITTHWVGGNVEYLSLSPARSLVSADAPAAHLFRLERLYQNADGTPVVISEAAGRNNEVRGRASCGNDAAPQFLPFIDLLLTLSASAGAEALRRGLVRPSFFVTANFPADQKGRLRERHDHACGTADCGVNAVGVGRGSQWRPISRRSSVCPHAAFTTNPVDSTARLHLFGTDHRDRHRRRVHRMDRANCSIFAAQPASPPCFFIPPDHAVTQRHGCIRLCKFYIHRRSSPTVSCQWLAAGVRVFIFSNRPAITTPR